MNNPFRQIIDSFKNESLDYRAKLYQIIQIAGVLVCMIVSINSALNGNSLKVVLFTAIGCIILFGSLFLTSVYLRYNIINIVAIIAIFFFFFFLPINFFFAGGYNGSMPYYFFLAIVFTVLLLEGKKALFVALLELAVYIGIFVFAHLYPDLVSSYITDPLNILLVQIVDMTVVGSALAIITYLFFRHYKRKQRELEEAREEALRLSETKNTFLSNMSHEIRTPINVMLGMTEMVLRSSRDETVIEFAQKIKNAGKMLQVLVSNILDVSKIESGLMVLVEDRYPLSALIRELYEFGSESARKEALDFNIVVDENMPRELLGDITRIKQIVSNFLSNAAKYTNVGRITLKFSCKESKKDKEMILCISVKDTGIGIKAENIPILFDSFTRIETTRQYTEGTGLGLAIAKELTERMKGRIYIKSEYGAGSEFWIEIPQGIVNREPVGNWERFICEKKQTAEESFIAPTAQLLVVDDNVENLLTVKALLQRTQIRVDLAESGAKCIEAVEKVDYDVILMDYMMPEMDGIETFRRLKEAFPDFDTPLIALTANAIAGTESRLIDEGFFAYLTKPVQAQKLEETVIKALELRSVDVIRRTICPDNWANAELKAALKQILAPCGISLEQGLENTGGDLALLARLADVFVRNYPISFAQSDIVSEVDSHDYEKLRHLAHSFKSGAGYVGAYYLSSLAERLERACAEGNGRIINLSLQLLCLELESVEKALSAFAGQVHAAEPGTQGRTQGDGSLVFHQYTR